MKILLINNNYPTADYPEIGTYIQSIKDDLSAAGNTVDVLALYVTGSDRWSKLKNYASFYKRIILKDINKYECLYVNHYVFLIPLFLKIPFYKGKVIFHWHGEELVNDSFIIKLLRRLCRTTLKKEHIHISPSEYYKNVIVKKLSVNDESILVSPSGGVDTDIFRPDDKQRDNEKFNIGFASSLSEHKGIAYFHDLIQNSNKIESLINEKVCFHYIKYGSECSYWANEFSKYPNVIGHEKYKKADIQSFYNQIDVLLMISKRESLGLVAVEAMSCNIPVIARDTSSMPEIVKSGISGELVSYDPPCDELIERLAHIRENYADYKPRQFAKANYSTEAVINFYKELLK